MRILLLLCLMLLPVQAQAETATTAPSQSANNIKGDVLYWEGEELVVKDILGREFRLHVNGETKISGAAGKLKTGDKIEATMTPQGHASTITLQIPEAGSAAQGAPAK